MLNLLEMKTQNVVQLNISFHLKITGYANKQLILNTGGY